MAEKKVGKSDAVPIAFRRENGKIIARASCFDGEQAVVLAGQVFEARLEDGTMVFVVKDKAAPSFTREDLKRVLTEADESGDGPWDAIDLLSEIADAMDLPE